MLHPPFPGWTRLCEVFFDMVLMPGGSDKFRAIVCGGAIRPLMLP